MNIVLKSSRELEKMHRSGLIVWDVLNGLREMVKPGISTLDLEQCAERRSTELKARPAFKGYLGYPCVLCTSVNQEVVHGIPSASRKLREGDIVSIDFDVPSAADVTLALRFPEQAALRKAAETVAAAGAWA